MITMLKLDMSSSQCLHNTSLVFQTSLLNFKQEINFLEIRTINLLQDDVFYKLILQLLKVWISEFIEHLKAVPKLNDIPSVADRIECTCSRIFEKFFYHIIMNNHSLIYKQRFNNKHYRYIQKIKYLRITLKKSRTSKFNTY